MMHRCLALGYIKYPVTLVPLWIRLEALRCTSPLLLILRPELFIDINL
jgi:hypothetical protein